jgi:hemerythrin-like domain-containing protein
VEIDPTHPSEAPLRPEETMQATLRATQILMAEHDVILNVLDCLEKLATRTSASGRLDAGTARQILEVLGTFADRCHHGKEEGALFPMLVRRGLPEKVGPLAVMLSEHETGRKEIADMRAAVEASEAGRPGAAAGFAAHAQAYVELLVAHIAKENNVLFPMADGMLGDAEQEEVLARFAAVESQDLGAGVHERCLALVEDLMRRLEVEPAARPIAHGGGCCGHGASCA